MLSVKGVHTFYGAIEALKGVDVEVAEGEIVTLIGANGAGKSTLLMTICGVTKARRGTVSFTGEDITGKRTDEIVRHGIACAPEGRRIFPRMTVRENLQMGALTSDPARYDHNLEVAYTLFPRLKERENQRGGTLSGGEQQMLAIARALARDIKVLLLDEPYEGLAPVIVDEIEKTLIHIKEQGITTVIVEQNAVRALELADRSVILDTGSIVFDGSAAEVLENEELRAEYLAI